MVLYSFLKNVAPAIKAEQAELRSFLISIEGVDGTLN